MEKLAKFFVAMAGVISAIATLFSSLDKLEKSLTKEENK